ncbi:MAG: 3-oxoacyl-ACP synthase III family protein [Planctomycetota bacterium]|jgi:3-oxoacyl-[acyl-carrier-protein] synthase-3
MTGRIKVRIAGTGSFTPEKRLTNADLEKMVDTSDDWITQRTGIKERRIADEGVVTSDMGAEAARKAIESAGIRPEDVDLLYCATCTPDRIAPATAAYLQAKIGAFNAGAMDVVAGCSGFVYTLNAAWHAVATGQSKCCLVVGTEMLSRITDYEDRTTCVLLGDAAGALVLVPSDGPSDILYGYVGNDGRLSDLIIVTGWGTAFMPTPERLARREQFLKMRGREVYKIAVPKFVDMIRSALSACDLTLDDVKLIIPHQMNARMIEAVAQRLELPPGRMYMNIDRYGNTSVASIPLALDEALREGKIERGDLVLLTAVGAGVGWGTMILRY